MEKLIIDTQKLISLGTDGTGRLVDKYAITSYQGEEISKHNLTVLPPETTTEYYPSWPDFVIAWQSSGGIMFATWSDGTTTLQALYIPNGIGRKAFCERHNATVQLSVIHGEAFYLCDSFKFSNSDFAQLNGIILNPKERKIFTGDSCLGKTSTVVRKILNAQSQRG